MVLTKKIKRSEVTHGDDIFVDWTDQQIHVAQAGLDVHFQESGWNRSKLSPAELLTAT